VAPYTLTRRWFLSALALAPRPKVRQVRCNRLVFAWRTRLRKGNPLFFDHTGAKPQYFGKAPGITGDKDAKKSLEQQCPDFLACHFSNGSEWKRDHDECNVYSK